MCICDLACPYLNAWYMHWFMVYGWCHWHGDLPGLIVFSALVFNFLDNHGVVGFPVVFYWCLGS